MVGLLAYVGGSLVLLVLSFPGLKRFDGPPIPPGTVDTFAFGPAPLPERESFMFHYGLRRMLSGSLWRAAWLTGFSVACGVVFFTGPAALPWPAGLLFSLPSGFGLAVALYNVLKVLGRRQ